ncbi:MAG: hypothetical protein AAGA60_24865 [Cyanobacteria bacterium P01_E01_bin.42]
MSKMIGNVAKHSGKGAQFWAYVSPQNDTENMVTQWTVKIEATDNNWVGIITSDNPKEILQTPNLSGIFKVTVTASGVKFSEKNLSPTSDSKPDIGCNSNCAAMVGIVATADGTDANYWTVWDALC